MFKIWHKKPQKNIFANCGLWLQRKKLGLLSWAGRAMEGGIAKNLEYSCIAVTRPGKVAGNESDS